MTSVDLPISTTLPTLRPGSDEWARLANRAKLLAWASLAYMTLEGAVAIVAGIIAASVALIGFGLDSAIEGIASVVIVWRFAAKRMLSDAAERRAQQLVAAQFFILAPYIGYESVTALVNVEKPDASWIGVGLAITSIMVMPWLGIQKQRIGRRIGSGATKGEGAQNLLCAYLAGALLVGLLGNALFGLWWLDPGVGLLIVGFAVKEGIESWRGTGCCVPAAIPLERAASHDDCCP